MKTFLFTLSLAFAGILFPAFAPLSVTPNVALVGEKCFRIHNDTPSDVTVRVGQSTSQPTNDILISAGQTSSNICVPVDGKLYLIQDGKKRKSIDVTESMDQAQYAFSELF